MRRTKIAMTLNDAGGGTASTPIPLWGEVAEVSYQGGTAFIGIGTVVLTRDDGGTILAGSTGSGKWRYAPFQNVSTPGLGSVGANAPVPVDGYMQAVVTGGGSAASGTIDIYVR